MKATRTSLEIAAGKLISAVQREWVLQAGEPSAAESEEVMHSCHRLLQAAKAGGLAPVLEGNTISHFIGRDWVSSHPAVLPAIAALEAAAKGPAGV